jgi:hypothetical protein
MKIMTEKYYRPGDNNDHRYSISEKEKKAKPADIDENILGSGSGTLRKVTPGYVSQWRGFRNKYALPVCSMENICSQPDDHVLAK